MQLFWNISTLSIKPHPKLCIVFTNIMEIMEMAEREIALQAFFGVN